MRTIDIALRIFTIVTFIGFFVFPDPLQWVLVCGGLFSMGLWAVMFPPGIIGWAKMRHRELDPSDETIWWVPRLVGAGLIVVSLILIAMFFSNRFS